MSSPTIRLRRLAAGAIALLSAIVVLVNAYGRERGWTADPGLGQSLGRLTDRIVGGRPVDEATLQHVYRHSLWSPFSPEPFLARAIEAEREGRDGLALRALDEAIIRDPRSVAARLLRAEYFRKNGDTAGATREIAALVRIAPHNSMALARPLAELAGDPQSERIIRDLVVNMPELRPALFGYLSQTPGSSDLMVKLALQLPAERPTPDWVDPVVRSLLVRGDAARARTVWSSLAGVESADRLITNGQFQTDKGTPPFNWRLASGPDGVAEYGRAGGLEVSYFGRNDLMLAEQTLTLRPGRYIFSSTVEGRAGAANWSMQCVGSDQPLATLPLSGKPVEHWNIDVPPTCQVQQLALTADADDVAATRTFTVRSVRLDRP